MGKRDESGEAKGGSGADAGATGAGISWAEAGRILLGFAVALAGSLAFLQLALPLPWFLGALTFSLAASVLGAPIARPRQLSVPVRIVLGVAIGAAFSPALFARLDGMLVSLLVLVPFNLAIIWTGMRFFERMAGFDRPTAFFCAVPGGLTDMVSMAGDAGARQRTVVLVQATRITLIVFLLPFWLQLVEGHRIGGAVPKLVRIHELGAVDALVLAAIGVAGWRIARALGLAGAPMVGPMILSGLAHAFGFTFAKVPIEVLIFAQVTLGLLLGAQFRGLTFAEFSGTMVWGLVFGTLLAAATGVLALAMARLTGFESTMLLIAYAPGGQSELNLLAIVLGLDVAFTALHHLCRLAIVIFGAQIVFAVKKDWRKDSD
jgi:hypothetical protein